MAGQILIVDDHEVVRRGIRTVLSARPEWKVCGEAADGIEAVEKATALRPDVVLMDIQMPIVDGLSATKQIMDFDPTAHVIVVTDYQDRDLQAIAFEAGACRYVSKEDLSTLPEMLLLLHRNIKG